MTPDEFSQTHWGANVGRPLNDRAADVVGSREELTALFQSDPDGFFAPIYSDPYESMCVADHAAAEALPNEHQDARRNVAEGAYKTTWEWSRVPELCALVSDDVETLWALLVMHGIEGLADFTRKRLHWYARGRVPWGYRGDFPNGRWLVL